MCRLNKQLKLWSRALPALLFFSQAFAAISESEIQFAIGTKLNPLQTATAWKEFVQSKPDFFPITPKENSVVVDKMTLNLEDSTYTLGVGYQQIFLKADFERVKKILTSPEIFKNLYGLDAEANVGSVVDGFQARIFKKVPIVSDQDYTLEYKNFEEGGVWFQRAKQVVDKNSFALRDNIKVLERSEGGVVYREYSLVYILRWYLRAIGPQVRSLMERELIKVNASLRCTAESDKELTQGLVSECWKFAQAN